MEQTRHTHANHRERMEKKLIESADTFAKHELLEILLFKCIARKDVNPIAHNLINRFGSLKAVLHAPAEDLMSTEGVGPKVAAYLIEIGAVIDEISREEWQEIDLDTSQNIAAGVASFVSRTKNEVFCLFCLDSRLNLINGEIYSDNSPDGVFIPYTKFGEACNEFRPNKVVVGHNHPDLTCMPSEADDRATEALAEYFRLLHVELYDHVIIGSDGFFSYRTAREEIIKRMIKR